LRKAILIIPNSFKESADSVQITKLFNEFLPDSLNKILKPISDGGDGFLEVCRYYFEGELLNYKISLPYSKDEFNCEVLYVKEQKTIYIESANVLGLKIIPPELRKPLQLSSKGLGELIKQISKDVETGELEVSEVVIGIGGTGTIDMGIGACSRLGLKLLDSRGMVIEPVSQNFMLVDLVNKSNFNLPFQITCITDVNTTLFGSNGAINLYGQQKGASANDIKLIEDGLLNILKLLKNKEIYDLDNEINGAGGGLATGLHIFLNARIMEAIDYISMLISQKVLDSADYIITGEGAFDSQSSEGKGASIIINKFKDSKKPIFLVCGKIDTSIAKQLAKNVIPIEISSFFNSSEDSIRNIREGIRLASLEIIKHIEK
jgi:glycerate 2-kinase